MYRFHSTLLRLLPWSGGTCIGVIVYKKFAPVNGCVMLAFQLSIRLPWCISFHHWHDMGTFQNHTLLAGSSNYRNTVCRIRCLCNIWSQLDKQKRDKHIWQDCNWFHSAFKHQRSNWLGFKKPRNTDTHLSRIMDLNDSFLDSSILQPSWESTSHIYKSNTESRTKYLISHNHKSRKWLRELYFSIRVFLILTSAISSMCRPRNCLKLFFKAPPCAKHIYTGFIAAR